MVLFIDNYDSFSYNLVQMLGVINPDYKVIRNDECSIGEIEKMAPSHIVISPGPGYPKSAGICEELVQKSQGKYKILGVCLGHQAICEAFGGEIIHSKEIMHGKQSEVDIDVECSLLQGLPPRIKVARYHSLVAKRSDLPKELKVVATDADGQVMAVEHRKYPIYGVQFHPESILTPLGNQILENFLK